VARALAELMAASPLETVIVDDRPDWNSAERFPRARRLLSWDAGIDAACSEPASTLACVMTCSHDTDLDLLRRLLKSPPAFVGLIGSRSKRACLFGRLVASGIDEALVQRIHCPIGVGDTGKEPRLVAISMAAQLLIEAKNLAATAR
jgi:xanthine dehydrogenase accessory factor